MYAPTPAKPVKKPSEGLSAARGMDAAAVIHGMPQRIFIHVFGLNLDGGVIVARLVAPVVSLPMITPRYIHIHRGYYHPTHFFIQY